MIGRPRPELQGFAAFVKRLRTETRPSTRNALARELGVDPSLITYWEQARVEPNDPTVVHLAQVARIPVAELAALLPRYAHVTAATAGGRIRLARWARYETRARFASRLGVPEASLTTWEQADTVGVETAELLAAHGVDVSVANDPPANPVHYMGSKSVHITKLLAMVPCTRNFVEPFGGSATLLFARKPAVVEVYNDLDGRLVALFRTLRDPERAAGLKARLELTLYSRDEFRQAIRLLKARGGSEDDVAWAMFVLLGQGRYGLNLEFESNWYPPLKVSAVRGWWKRVAWVDHWHERLAHVAIEHDDGVDVIERYDSPDTTHYVDPPYPSSTTTRARVYKHHFPLAEHRRLVDTLIDVEGAVVLTGYRHKEYQRLEDAGWELVHLGGKEHVWRNGQAAQLAAVG